MTDETRSEEPSDQTEAAAVATADAATEGEKQPAKLHQTVELRDIGPCRKHIKVTVDRADIDTRLNEKFSELVVDANVSGFRPGKAPRKIIERRFQKEVSDQVKSEMLLASLEQLAEENDIAPLSSPNINPNSIEIPASGPLVYEFEVEVRPQFDLPNYKGLKIRRPIYTIKDTDVQDEERRILAPDGQVVPKPEGSAQVGDIVVADVSFRFGDRLLGTIKETSFRVDKQLAFRDGVAPRFAEQVKGANAGDTRQVDVTLSQAAADATVRGETVKATFEIKDVKTLRLPELTPQYLAKFGVASPETLHELINVFLQRRLEYTQRQSARQQVIQQISATSTWELPPDLLRSQAIKALARKRMEMEADGISEQEIQNRLRMLQQDILRSTELSLKEHFVLQKIAEVEKIDVTEDDINDEIDRLAHSRGESPRRFRAQLEKEDALDTLVAEMYERKALDVILDSADYEDVPMGQEEEAPQVASVEAQAVPGEMQDPSAEAEPAPETPAVDQPK